MEWELICKRPDGQSVSLGLIAVLNPREAIDILRQGFNDFSWQDYGYAVKALDSIRSNIADMRREDEETRKSWGVS